VEDYNFTTVTKVPDSVVRQIVVDFVKTLVSKISENNITNYQLIDIILEVQTQFCGKCNEEPMYQIGDYKLTQRSVNNITTLMRNSMKIASVREFRNSSGCSLAEARDIILEHFGATPTGAQNFLNALHPATSTIGRI
jgi:ribosomal protein L7/L12